MQIRSSGNLALHRGNSGRRGAASRGGRGGDDVSCSVSLPEHSTRPGRSYSSSHHRTPYEQIPHLLITARNCSSVLLSQAPACCCWLAVGKGSFFLQYNKQELSSGWDSRSWCLEQFGLSCSRAERPITSLWIELLTRSFPDQYSYSGLPPL